MMRTIHRLAPAVLGATLALAAPGCGAPDLDHADDLVEVPDGKADNFFSTTAREYFVDGTGRLVLDAADAARPAAEKLVRARELMSLKNLQIAWFLHVRLVDKEAGGPPHGDANAATYPGFHAQVRDGEYVDSKLTALPDGKTFTFAVRLQIAGYQQLLTALPGKMLDATHKKITLQMGNVPNADLARTDPESGWFRDPQWDSGSFDPSKLPADKLEPIDLVLSPQPASSDAFPDVNKLLADGRLTIDVHYGWDYWSRYDIQLSRKLYDQLVREGFRSPAKSYETYLPAAGPLTKTIVAGGKKVSVEIRIFHPSDTGVAGIDPDTDEGGALMEKAMYQSLATSDVIVFSGHSGFEYGFALADWRKTSRGALDYPQLRQAPMPKGAYQIVMASGCDTFSTGEAFRQNPNKLGLQNLDVITTTTFSDATTNAETNALFDALFRKASAGRFSPSTWGQLLTQMNGTADIGAMYGVHGIDKDPKLHPFATVATLGKACTTAATCGGDGNKCTGTTGGRKVCTATCLADSACPTGYRCKQVASGGTIVGRQCMK